MSFHSKATVRNGVRVAVVAALGLIVAMSGLAAMPALGQQATGVPAKVVPFDPPIRNESYKFTDYGKSDSRKDDKTGKAKFRVVERSGNCCENYITVGPDGTLYDLGGSYISISKNDGKTWEQVQPQHPLLNGEGTIALAPGGDIIGVEWDPYSGDHLLSYKYDAESEQWLYLEAPLHTPFYDRPWLSVVPGPFTIQGAEVPYVVFVDGYPHRGPFLYSTDGLTYVRVSNPFLDHNLEGDVQSWVKTKKDRDLDWGLPNSESPITPLGGGSALAPPGPFASSWSVLNPETVRWSAFSLPKGDLDGRLLVDSKGRIHNLVPQGQNFTYRISSDGAKTWKSTLIPLPEGNSITQIDFRMHSGLGIAVVGIHADAGSSDRDLLYKLDVAKTPRVTRMYEIGLGDTDASAGVGQQIRMDFQTVAIFPDGRVAVSFLDSTTGPIYHFAELVLDRLGPALAIEL